MSLLKLPKLKDDNSVINSNMTEMEKKKQARHNITIKKRHEPGASANMNGNSNDS